MCNRVLLYVPLPNCWQMYFLLDSQAIWTPLRSKISRTNKPLSIWLKTRTKYISFKEHVRKQSGSSSKHGLRLLIRRKTAAKSLNQPPVHCIRYQVCCKHTLDDRRWAYLLLIGSSGLRMVSIPCTGAYWWRQIGFDPRRRKSVDQQTEYHHLADVLSHETISIDRIFRDIS